MLFSFYYFFEQSNNMIGARAVRYFTNPGVQIKKSPVYVGLLTNRRL